MKITHLTASLAFDPQATLGEGPLWDPARNRLVYVDILGRTVHEFDPSTGLNRTLSMPTMVGAIGLTTKGDWIAAAGSSFARIDPASGNFAAIVEVESPDRRTRMNDGAVDPAGRFWAGTMSLEGEAGRGTLYRLDPDGTVTPMIAPVTTSNGPAWSPDGRTMYYVDTRTRRIDALDFDVETGTCTNRRPFVDFEGQPGRPDGVIVDEEGGLWVGLWMGRAARRYRPDGTLDTVVDLPASCVTKCAFGGPDLLDMYITTARLPGDEENRAIEPQAGGLFHVRPGVRGMPPARFAG